MSGEWHGHASVCWSLLGSRTARPCDHTAPPINRSLVHPGRCRSAPDLASFATWWLGVPPPEQSPSIASRSEATAATRLEHPGAGERRETSGAKGCTRTRVLRSAHRLPGRISPGVRLAVVEHRRSRTGNVRSTQRTLGVLFRGLSNVAPARLVTNGCHRASCRLVVRLPITASSKRESVR